MSKVQKSKRPLLLKLLIFALAVLQIFDTCILNVKLWLMAIPKSLTDLANSSWNPTISIFSGCVYQATYTEISQNLSSFDCS